MDLRHKICLAIEYAKQDHFSGEEGAWRSLKDMAAHFGVSESEMRQKIDNGDFSYAEFKKMQNFLGDGFDFDLIITLPDGTKI